MKICKEKNCKNEKFSKGYCKKHYAQLRRHGKTMDRTIYSCNEIKEKDTYAEIILYNRDQKQVGKALIDKKDIEKCKKYKWGIHDYNTNYVSSGNIFLHRYITNASESEEVDHINHNTLDNRSSNLKKCTHAENMQNRLNKQKTSKHGRMGVSYVSRIKKYHAYIGVNGKRINLGYFAELDKAIEAREKAQLYYWEAVKEVSKC